MGPGGFAVDACVAVGEQQRAGVAGSGPNQTKVPCRIEQTWIPAFPVGQQLFDLFAQSRHVQTVAQASCGGNRPGDRQTPLLIPVAVLGSLYSLDFVWLLSDVMNGLMALPNLIGLLLLSGVAAAETRSYFEREKSRLP